MDTFKAIIILTMLLVLFPVLTSAQEKTVNNETESVSPHVNKILNGPINRQGLEKMPYKTWFVSNFKTYLVDENSLKNIKKKKLKNLKILAFMGTWCHDSNREIPRLMRVCEYLEIEDQLELYAVDVDKSSIYGREKGFDIKKTPTIIFLQDGEEIGRILEEPETSFEQYLEELLK